MKKGANPQGHNPLAHTPEKKKVKDNPLYPKNRASGWVSLRASSEQRLSQFLVSSMV